MKAAPASAPVRTLTLVVNGRARQVTAAPDTSSLTILRNDLGLSAPKYGCGLGQCGACTIHVDGIAARACVIPVGGIVGTVVGHDSDGQRRPTGKQKEL